MSLSAGRHLVPLETPRSLLHKTTTNSSQVHIFLVTIRKIVAFRLFNYSYHEKARTARSADCSLSLAIQYSPSPPKSWWKMWGKMWQLVNLRLVVVGKVPQTCFKSRARCLCVECENGPNCGVLGEKPGKILEHHRQARVSIIIKY